jgi:hypothetical protein
MTINITSTHDVRIADRLVRYGLSRNVEATDANGNAVKICMAVVHHENGYMQTIAINEELIRFMGEGAIEQEIARAIKSPSDASEGFPFRH